MELFVCIKQVPDDAVTVTLGDNGEPNLADITAVVNAFDTYALEMAARFKEAHGGAVTVASIGGEEVVPALRSCLAVGADRACRIAVEGDHDTLGVAQLLAKAVTKADGAPFDVIFCGSESTDRSSGQVGAQLAEVLGIPVVTNVLSVEPADGGVLIKQETDEGYRMVEAACPCVVTVVKPGYEPRYPSIKSKMAARKMPVAELSAADLEADSYAAKVARTAVTAPARRQAGVKIQEKDAAEAVRRALDLMAEQKLL